MSNEKETYDKVPPEDIEDPTFTNQPPNVQEDENSAKMSVGKLWAIFKHELTPNKELFSLKFLGLLFYGGMYSVSPYYTVHMQQLGLTVREIAIIYTFLPFSAIAGPVMNGMLADYTNRYNAVTSFNILMTIVFNMCMVFTPVSTLPSLTSPTTHVSSFSGITCTQKFVQIQDNLLSCHTNCFKENEIYWDSIQDLESFQLFCDNQLIGDNGNGAVCQHPLKSKPSCFYEMSFLPSNKTPSAFELEKEYLQYSTKPCNISCHSKSEDGKMEDSGFTNSKTFWVYFTLRMCSQFFQGSSFSMMDAAIMAVMLKKGADYGKQRIVSMLSLATMPFIGSVIISAQEGPVDYSPVFYMQAVLLASSVIVSRFIDLSVAKTEEKDRNIFKELRLLFHKVEVCIFLVVMFTLGMNWGYLENFLFVFLNNLNAPPYLLGLTLTFGCLTGIPVLIVSDRIVEYFGRHKIFFVGFLAYTVRMFGYSVITNPWYCFIFECLEIFTYQIMWVSAVTYFPILAPPSLLATLAGVAGCVHYNIGRGAGSLVGGFLIASVDLVWTFRIFGIASFLFAFLYLFLQKKFLQSPKQEEGETQTDCEAGDGPKEQEMEQLSAE